MRVLVVEDEVRLAATLQDLLELNGYTVDVCHDGEAGLDNALTSIYDVILLDVMLPKLDGFTVLRRLRAEGSTTPVVAQPAPNNPPVSAPTKLARFTAKGPGVLSLTATKFTSCSRSIQLWESISCWIRGSMA